ncbi:MAG TPA: hypothetical protein VHX19_15750 [Stellaceae bacterium]|nr:hypothetical protein [Stellaceae bacterium]
MESVIEELRLAARRLLGLRAMLCTAAVVICGYLLGSTLSHGATLDAVELTLLAVATVAAATFAMRSAEVYAARQRKKKLDALYGRDSSS